MPDFNGRRLELRVTTRQGYSLFHIPGDYSTELWKLPVGPIMEEHGLVSFIVHPDYLTIKRTRARRMVGTPSENYHVKVGDAFKQALGRYEAKPYPGELTVLAVKRHPAGMANRLGGRGKWRREACDSSPCPQAPGDHSSSLTFKCSPHGSASFSMSLRLKDWTNLLRP